MDYLPGSSAVAEGLADQKLGGEARAQVGSLVQAVRKQALASGYTDFGALALPLINSVGLASAAGTNVFHIYRALLDCVTFAAQHGNRPSLSKDQEEHVVATLAKQLRVSKTTARKYMKEAQDSSADSSS